MITRQKIKIGFALGVLAIAAITTWQLGGFSQLTPEVITAFIEQFGVWGVVVFVLVTTLAIVFFVPATPLNIAAGLLFGPVMGLVWSMVGLMAGALISFFTARWLGKDAAMRWLGQKHDRLAYYEQKIEDNAFWAVIFFRVVPIFPFFIPNYVFGLTRMSWKIYFAGTLVGILPSVIVFTYFGGSIISADPFHLATAIVGVSAFILVMRQLSLRFGKTQE